MANILIVGDGAIGLLLSHFLSASNRITVLTRNPSTNTRFYSRGNNASKKINAQFISLNQLNKNSEFDLVLFTVKAFQVPDAFAQVKPFLPKGCSVVLSHNGMGNVDEISNQLNSNQALYFLTTSMAGYKSNQYIVQHTGEGQSIIGGCNNLALQDNEVITNAFKAVPNVKWTDNIHQLRFEKLLVNIAINPLSALNNVKNGELRAPKFNAVIFNALNEACNIARAQGLNIPLIKALNTAYKIMELTCDNYSSMQQDVVHNRTTEIRAICGYIAQQGKLYNIKTPYNNELLAKIEAKKSVV
ncbi:2-dehydropantoate 2-reductase [Pseudoalteromonas sp. MMG006]|uniref:ketopantoate reductase family protein n=1 Tax=unclassified Pseudoalteromonas TaxID=194690 RepID=UPI001B38D11F|nr:MULTISPECIES: 2-dehydropantoate 2-reductase [unclassified Pseudoalteromonas]MBQ4799605.1 2-dehydropantoate 2-reductase [Pseudoalteromonas sp. MMG006]MBQ4858961.1 2-dehydropantoate 2-reductase [Pseudoalteromonas sp. MMG007]